MHTTFSLAQAQWILGIVLGSSGRSRSISHAAGSIFGNVADTLCSVTQGSSRALHGVAEDVTKAADCEGVRCQIQCCMCEMYKDIV